MWVDLRSSVSPVGRSTPRPSLGSSAPAGNQRCSDPSTKTNLLGAPPFRLSTRDNLLCDLVLPPPPEPQTRVIPDLYQRRSFVWRHKPLTPPLLYFPDTLLTDTQHPPLVRSPEAPPRLPFRRPQQTSTTLESRTPSSYTRPQEREGAHGGEGWGRTDRGSTVPLVSVAPLH